MVDHRDDEPDSKRDDNDDSDERLLEFIDRLIELHVGGDTVDLKAFCADAPESLREQIRQRYSEYIHVVDPILDRMTSSRRAGTADVVRIADFRVIRELGRGGMGVVYLAWERSLHRPVALKVLHRGHALSAQHIARFRREGVAAGKLQHPAIVRVLSVGEWEGIAYIAMDYLDGRSLGDELDDLRDDREGGRLLGPDRTGYGRQVAFIIQRAAEGLHFAHENGVIHRDVKPQNIMLTESGRPCIVDFGLAKEVDKLSLSREGDLLGTPFYMSPEQVLAKRVKIDHRTDVFSLGAVMYEMLTLRRAFDGETMDRVLYQISFREPEPIRKRCPQIHRDLETICHRALEKDPAKRFASMADMASELDRFLNNETLQIRPVPQVVRWTRALVRNKPALAVAICLLVFLLSLPFLVMYVRYLEKLEKMPKLTIAGVADGLDVYTRWIELETGLVGPRKRIGATPIEAEPLEAGYYRIVVVGEDGSFAEMTRYLREGSGICAPKVWLRSPEEVKKSMKTIAGGAFEFGDGTDGVPPIRREQSITLETFLIDECEVSIGEYKHYMSATGTGLPEQLKLRLEDEPAIRLEIMESDTWDYHPITCVRIEEARRFAEWKGKRLPTMFEWEGAARGKNGRLQPWASEALATIDLAHMDQGKKNLELDYVHRSLHNTLPVRSLEAGNTPEGLFHMLGNVKEWTETAMPSEAGYAVLFTMGMSWQHPFDFGGGDRASLKGYDPLSLSANHHGLGFRCAKTVRR